MSLAGIFPIDQWNFKSQSILKSIPEEDHDRLYANMTVESYNKGDVIFKEGAVPSGIFFIQKGIVKKYKVDRDGREQIMYVAGTGELIGYHAILSEERYPDSASAIEDCIIAFIPKEDFLEVLHSSVILSQRLLKNMSHEYAVLTNNISVFTQRTARERVAITLIVLREKYKNEDSNEETINISRSDLSNMAGIAKENLVRILKEFKNLGVLFSEGRKITITNIKMLAEISSYSNKTLKIR
ncbi:Crp/Fnr family transcriptional regulator [Pedobacter sp. PLR]|uniref:Crp/Fnr family transcriptional regulator n=1 Tax=Pedobacter sp. PLR TaxID=2994465 RepID=UPI0022469398|nr:Crp/Fnr family transcriptional regulator [Pedobacter sp. PLR]MCX2454146.1 Crp/Fnr family transcriptional regulator [Pedobacter sp. PLR]